MSFPAYRLIGGLIQRQDVAGGEWTPLSKIDADGLLERAGNLVGPQPADDAYICPICDAAVTLGDVCATDIELGTCHAACLHGSPTVDLETGETVAGPIPTFRYEATLGDIERAQSSGERANDWRDDPSADDRWNAGLDYGQTQLCKLLGVDPDKVSWDAATETLDGDVRAVIGNILTAAYGDNWRSALSRPQADDGWRPTHRHVKRGSEYMVVYRGRLQVDGDLDNEKVVIYRGKDGQVWVRPTYEFNDGRFEALPSAPATGGGE